MLAGVFGNVFLDIILAIIFGAFGGFVAELIENKGNLKSITKPTPPDTTYNLGLWSNVIIGSAAALVIFFIMAETDVYKFVGSAVLAGVGGSALLVAIKEQYISSLKGRLTEQANMNSDRGADALEKAENKLREYNVDGRDSSLVIMANDARATSEAMRTEIERIRKELRQLG